MSLDVRNIPVFTKYAVGTLQRPKFLEYLTLKQGTWVHFSHSSNI